MDLIPLRPVGRQVIDRYGPSGFHVSGVFFAGSILVFPDRTLRWSANSAAAITWEGLRPVVEHGRVEILLIGLGRRAAAISQSLRGELRHAGIAAEPMDTGAACRTYNVLLAEDRRVGAALIPPM